MFNLGMTECANVRIGQQAAKTRGFVPEEEADWQYTLLYEAKFLLIRALNQHWLVR